ncbi:UDP-diphospho-muramoylpentapeptide beta-N-acetylglucosaminyltransferase [Clostridioides difficile]|nr:UDP-diphospho-muramoylpentapeptide beta-N-acetylglucosaminyltransferase [Clostridioides difficile]EKG0757974.1 UDP-diphospho-muramoylpentapeptide beta-N-acetylglucosaminyltransferase [Clostridioides difficile]EKG0785518.1 UDP-diphospho-muramoylpentapeptide beta-N-acetylglucosaminyltransferase [Clostridioides difficile]EKS6762333.1 UDP-diphospho-muramoylpentapeptide beta-N-acetylglucosaminyltransferase [Clostridioides difficile]MBH7872806.1 UDP-diphospho-muramoylpentapeptide beta-N-acetylgluc
MKVLILTGKFGMGHYSASNSLSEDIKAKFDNSEIIIKDIFEYIMPNYSDKMYKTFSILVNRGSSLYNLFYKCAENGKKDIKFTFSDYFLNKLDTLLHEVQPTVVISTFPFCSQLVSRYKEKYNSNLPLITCITDISSHSEWISKNTDCYLVASKSTKEELVFKGIDESKIKVNGIPVKKEFKRIEHVNHSTKKNILIMGGGLGLLPKSEQFYKELNSLEGVKTTVITGNNKKMYYKLYGRYENIEVVGYTNEVYKYMKDSDLIISKPGGITLFETIYSELPILAFNPFLQQEIDNASFILNNEIGRILGKNKKYYVDEIKDLIYDDTTLKEMSSNMKELKKQFDNNTLENILFSLDEQGACRECM